MRVDTDAKVEEAIQRAQWDFSAYQYATMIAPVVIADDVTGVGVANDWLVPLVYLGATGVFLYDNQDIIKDIILENRVLKQIGKLIRGNRNGDGFTYKLVPKVDGDYDNVQQGRKFI